MKPRNLLHDLRFSLRSFARRPLYAGAVVCSLGLGICACVVMYSVIYTLLLKPLAYAHPEELVHIGSTTAIRADEVLGSLSPAALLEIRARAGNVFSGVVGMLYDSGNLTNVPTPVQLDIGRVTEGYFDMLGVAPLLGRLPGVADFLAGAPPVVVLTEKVWRTQFQADPYLIGRTILLSDQPRAVIGVMPHAFNDMDETSGAWVPLQRDDPLLTAPTNRSMIALGRLRNASAAGLRQARAAVGTVAANLGAVDPLEYQGRRLDVERLGGGILVDRTQRRALWLLLGAVGCVLLVTCANVANLQLVHASARRRELGVRLALGASRARIMGQTLAESALLAVLGGVLGLLLAAWGVDAVRALLPRGFSPRQDQIALSLPVLGFSLAVTAFAGLASGLLPAWFASRQEVAGTLAFKRGAAGGGGGERTRATLVVAEIALALVLLTGAALLGQSFLSVLRVDPGVRIERVLTLDLLLSKNRYPNGPRRTEFFRRVLEALRAVPGVENAALSNTALFGEPLPYHFTTAGQSPGDPTLTGQSANYEAVSPGFLAALDIPLRAGRTFDAHDNADAPPVAMVNEEFARRYFPGVDPLGGSVRLNGESAASALTVVGVTANVRQRGLDQPPSAQFYVCYLQRPMWFSTLFVRAGGELSAESLTRAAQAAIWRLDPDQPISNVATLAQVRRASVGPMRLYLALFAWFAGLTLGLAALGIYGTVSYAVGQRTREFGIRLALGAQRTHVLRLVLGQGAWMAAAGMGLGAAISCALARVLAGLLYGVSASDPATLTLVAIVLGSVALLASYLPARRAMRVNPLTALREE